MTARWSLLSQIKTARLVVMCMISAASAAACASFDRSVPTRPPLSVSGIGDIETSNVTGIAAQDDGVDDDEESSEGKTNETGSQSKPNRLIYYKGSPGMLAKTSSDADKQLDGKTLQLNFVDAPASDVARSVISSALGQTVAIANGVQGTITLTAPVAVPARDALGALEQALGESGLTLLQTANGFLLTKLSDAPNARSMLGGSNAVGYGVTFAPVHNALASEILPLIEPFTSDRVEITANDLQSMIMLKGPAIDVRETMDAIKTFDTPFLTNRVFGLFKLRHASVDTVREEVEALLDAVNNGAAQTITITPLSRLNMVFVTARSQTRFKEARAWIERFDIASGGDERRLHYYPAQYTPADILADQLTTAFGGKLLGSAVGETQSQSIPNNRRQPVRQNRNGGQSSSDQSQLAITADTRNNALLIQATDQEYAEIVKLVEKMDVPSAQVLIEATIAEVTLTDDLSFGVRWFYENAESTASFPGTVPGSDGALGAFNSIAPGFNYSYFDGNVSVALDALASVTDVQVLSAPSIMVLNNQSANLQVGDEVPIVTQQAQSVTDGDAPIVSTLQLRETGVILEVKPRINASDTVVLEVTQEVSDVTPTTTSGIDSPTIQQRRFTSTVSVRNNGTVALGGLIRETFTDNESGVPVLKDIPLIGNVFKARDITKRRTELIIFLTPRIIRTDSDAQRAMRHLKREMRHLTIQSSSEQ